MAFLKRSQKEKDAQRRVIDLGLMDPLRFVQYQQWHELFLAGPTRSVVSTLSNDFPGLYYYDPREQVEHVLMFDGPIDWRACTLDRRVVEGPDGKPHLFVGLFSNRNLDDSIRLHESRRERTFLQGQEADDRDAMPDQWEALEHLTKQSFTLLPMPKAGAPYDWESAAPKCLATLNKRRNYRDIGANKLLLFFETFESDRSTYKLKPSKEYKGTAELISQAGLASSLLNYAEKTSKNGKIFNELGLNLEEALNNFYDPETGFFNNTYPPKGEEWTRAVIDTWYPFHNLFHILRAGQLARDEYLQGLVHKAVKRAISFVHACNYKIPLFAKLSKANEQGSTNDARTIGFALNPSVLGMYAMILVEAAQAYPEDADIFHSEATTALLNLHRWPIQQLFHQTIQLSWAAWASHRLRKPAWRDDFIRCLLLSCYRQGDNAGLFQGCAGLMYPTFRETVEAITPWIEFLDDIPELPLRGILDLVFDRARRFISPEPHSPLPQEGLATIEQPLAGQIGIAIYATPQLFDLAHLQSQLIRRK
jgi:hypothetical protein